MRRCLKLLRCSGDAARPVGVTTPRGLLLTHPLATSLRSGSGKPLPVESKAGAMPTDNGSWRYQNCHKLFWVGLRKPWPRWKDPLSFSSKTKIGRADRRGSVCRSTERLCRFQRLGIRSARVDCHEVNRDGSRESAVLIQPRNYSATRPPNSHLHSRQ